MGSCLGRGVSVRFSPKSNRLMVIRPAVLGDKEWTEFFGDVGAPLFVMVGVMIAIGFWSLFGLALMMRWTFSLLFWGGISNWLRNRRR